MMFRWPAPFVGTLLALGLASWVAQRGAVSAGADEDIGLFTHARGELHCEERELRHLCVPELRRFVDEGESARKEAYECCVDVLDRKKDDFWMLKNMTHLLLDLDGNIHVFDRVNRDNEFIQLGLEFGMALREHPDCIGDFDEDISICRCYPLYTKIMILKLKNAGRYQEAQVMFDAARRFSWNGKKVYGPGEAMRWDSFNQTPQIFLPGLRSMPLWPRSTWDSIPVAALLEEHYPTILEETQQVIDKKPEEFSPTYRFLFDKGDWNQVLLYHGREFRPECDELYPKTCALLRQWLPSKPGVPWVSSQQEQVLVLRLKPGTSVEMHSGPANSILNIHLGISGLEGASLNVNGTIYKWSAGKVIAWDGSYDHTIDCLNCTQTRVILMIRYMHPDLTKEHFRGMTKTQFESIDEPIFE